MVDWFAGRFYEFGFRAAGSFDRSSSGSVRADGMPDISSMHAKVAIQMRIGMTHPFQNVVRA
jgi:hypothetical protein